MNKFSGLFLIAIALFSVSAFAEIGAWQPVLSFEELVAADGGLCFNDSQCLPNQHCALGGSGAGECRDNPVVGECRTDQDCSWPKMCIGWYCH